LRDFSLKKARFVEAEKNSGKVKGPHRRIECPSMARRTAQDFLPKEDDARL